jgi:hypothetical protein
MPKVQFRHPFIPIHIASLSTMFDDLDTAERKTEDQQTHSSEESGSSSQLYRWAHFPAMLTFGILFIVFQDSAWRWHIAIGAGYTVYVFFFAFGTVLKDADDFFGDSRVPMSAVRLLIPHALILALLMAGVSWWFHIRPLLPVELTHEGRKGSLWDLFGWLVLGGAGIWQGFWMGGKLKRQFAEPDESA